MKKNKCWKWLDDRLFCTLNALIPQIFYFFKFKNFNFFPHWSLEGFLEKELMAQTQRSESIWTDIGIDCFSQALIIFLELKWNENVGFMGNLIITGGKSLNGRIWNPVSKSHYINIIFLGIGKNIIAICSACLDKFQGHCQSFLGVFNIIQNLNQMWTQWDLNSLSFGFWMTVLCGGGVVTEAWRLGVSTENYLRLE